VGGSIAAVRAVEVQDEGGVITGRLGRRSCRGPEPAVVARLGVWTWRRC
jgi:hypothetical protein